MAVCTRHLRKTIVQGSCRFAWLQARANVYRQYFRATGWHQRMDRYQQYPGAVSTSDRLPSTAAQSRGMLGLVGLYGRGLCLEVSPADERHHGDGASDHCRAITSTQTPAAS